MSHLDVISNYRGRLAPSPTGYLHLGHARTFWIAWRRARAAGGALVFRNEDLDQQRSRPEFVSAMYEDLRWLGLDWDEGPDIPPQSGKSGQPGGPAGGPFAPYSQSQRRNHYLRAWSKLRDSGLIYPCTCSRKDLEHAAQAPHDDDDEIPYPGTCRNKLTSARDYDSPAGVSWRFRVPNGETLSFCDSHFGPQKFVAGNDFSDFLLWRRDDVPSYQLAVVVDDAAMKITEVVRGADLLKSTARQLLLFRALELGEPQYCHCPLMRDRENVRLAKRNDALSLRALRSQGIKPAELLERFASEIDWL